MILERDIHVERAPTVPIQSLSDAESAVDLRGVSKQFGSQLAVNELSFSVPTGSIYGFIGPNGSGKTTTIRMIMNIIMPDSGQISILGQSNSRTVRDHVSYLPEERGLYKKMTVRRLLTYYGQLKSAPEPKLQNNIAHWLERMGLEAYADKKVEALSKGMSQKVQFIAAVVAEPKLLILDEPFSGLDPVNAEVLKEAILSLRRSGVTIIFSTHDMAMAERLCDRICMIFKGKKVLDGTLEEIQAAYGQDTIRVRTSGGARLLKELVGVDAVNDHGNFQEVRLIGNSQRLLEQLVAKTEVQQFEVTRPALQEIFVRIARPNGEVYNHA